MLKQVDEFELNQMPRDGGVYAFHLRAIRPETVGLGSQGPLEVSQIELVREKIYIQISKILQLEESLEYTGSIREYGRYGAHGVGIELKGSPYLSIKYLRDEIAKASRHDIPALVRSIERLSIFMPPLYVGITLSQSLRDRYMQHKKNHAAGADTSNFGGRLANAGFGWNDVVFSIGTDTMLGMGSETVRVLENYIHFLSRPRLGLS